VLSGCRARSEATRASVWNETVSASRPNKLTNQGYPRRHPGVGRLCSGRPRRARHGGEGAGRQGHRFAWRSATVTPGFDVSKIVA